MGQQVTPAIPIGIQITTALGFVGKVVGVHSGVGVVAIRSTGHRCRGCFIPPAIPIGIHETSIWVAFGGDVSRKDRRIGVQAVESTVIPGVDVAHHLGITGIDVVGLYSKTIGILVDVETGGVHGIVVDFLVAVIVNAVANLKISGVTVWVLIVTIPFGFRVIVQVEIFGGIVGELAVGQFSHVIQTTHKQ